ncbi:MAG TPA: imidazoleglycerol-phosphate dehydratase [Longimicrobiales bacterium]|nr:imidazoleglycerol-phosphate dehydratase [Longimicrobiales bacterium]
MSKLKRETKETRIVADVRIGSGSARVDVDDGFLAHMVETLARYAGLDIDIEATGDLRHHLVEDVAIVLGLALRDEVPIRAARYGWAQVPMDESLAEAAIDVGGRPYYVGKLPSKLYAHFLHSFATNLGATLHVRVLRGTDRHHRVEAAIKATGLALRQALAEGDAVFSTKGSVRLERLD